ncbi:hypothetical protein ACH4PU_28250 [Streptomyces sp. NPDC021100]|uniref:hypothetical protein n=1 Tax=Streptomyces sp. NPDC021100 TaxID=3365114 RepID=UPI0037A2A19D
MVTPQHEASHRIFLEQPPLLAPVFRLLGVRMPPERSVEVLSPDLTEIRPLERRVDSLLRVEPSDGSGTFLVAIESQGRKDADKVLSWAYYLAFLKAKYTCPVLLLVSCQDKATADWAAGPFHLGPESWRSLSVRPLVLGPGNVPKILDAEAAARDLTLATFSAMTHARDPEIPDILKALASALGSADRAVAPYYVELLDVALGDTKARETWRKLMAIRTYFPGRGTIIEETLQEGMARGRAEERAERTQERAEMVLRMLEVRGITVPSEVRERVIGCSDLEVLGTWVDRACTVSRAEEIFAVSR